MLVKPYSSEQMVFGATSGTGKLLTSVCWLGPLMAFKSQRFNREKTSPNVYSHLRSLLFAYNCSSLKLIPCCHVPVGPCAATGHGHSSSGHQRTCLLAGPVQR